MAKSFFRIYRFSLPGRYPVKRSLTPGGGRTNLVLAAAVEGRRLDFPRVHGVGKGAGSREPRAKAAESRGIFRKEPEKRAEYSASFHRNINV